MTLFLILWFADLCDKFSYVSVAMPLITIFTFIAAITYPADDPAEYKKEVLKIFKKYLWIPLCLCLLSVILPSAKTVYIATGFNIIQEATHTITESDTANKAIELLNIKLDEYLQDAKKDK